MKNRRLFLGLLGLPLLLAVPLLRAGRERREIREMLTPVAGTQGCAAQSGLVWISKKEFVCAANAGTVRYVNVESHAHHTLFALPEARHINDFHLLLSPDAKWVFAGGHCDKCRRQTPDKTSGEILEK